MTDPGRSTAPSALVQLRAYLAQRDLQRDARLPPERELCSILGVTRGELRKALDVLESEGQIWRHVGKGTFVGGAPTNEATSLSAMTNLTNPSEVMRTRILLEPEIAREAALHATADDLSRMRTCLDQSRVAETWRQYEYWDNRLHRTVAEAAHNQALLALFDTLNQIRRAVVWGRLRVVPERPPANHHSFAEHEAVVEMIAARDLTASAAAMRRHLLSVQRKLLEEPLGVEHPPLTAAEA